MPQRQSFGEILAVQRKRHHAPTGWFGRIVGCSIIGAAIGHMLLHGNWGQHDWGVIAAIFVGSAIAFNREIVRFVQALALLAKSWKGT